MKSRASTFGVVLGMAALMGLPRAAWGQLTLVPLGHVAETNRGSASAVTVAGHYAYVAEGSNGLAIYDVAQPATPARVGGFISPGMAYGVAVAGTNAYVAYGTNGLEIYNVSNPARVTALGHINNSSLKTALARAVAVSGRYAFVANDVDGLLTYEVSNPAKPVALGAANPGGAKALALEGPYAFVSCNTFGTAATTALAVIDLSNPTNPVVVGTSAGGGGNPGGIAVVGTRVYLAEGQGLNVPPIPTGGLDLFDVTDPARPVFLGLTRTLYGGSEPGLTVAGFYAFLANGSRGVSIYDTSAGTNLAVVAQGGDEASDAVASGATLAGAYLYLANGPDGLRSYALTPTLGISLADPGHLLLSWPAPASFLVQQNPDLAAGLWTTLTNLPVVAGASNWLSLPLAATNQALRLFAP